MKSLLARGHDRKVTQAAAEACDWKALETKPWNDPPGKMSLLDTDGDGKADLRAEYRKGEDQPYRWERISE